MREVKDHFFWKARQAGFEARSVYKLAEIDKKHRLLTANQLVIELGAAPGGWSKYIAQKIKPRGTLYAVDQKSLAKKIADNIVYLQEDVLKLDITQFGAMKFDLLLSDLAPSTTGIRSVDQARSYELSSYACSLSFKLLKPHGSCVVKMFQGPDTKKLSLLLKRKFEKVTVIKPASSRKESYELFLLASRLTGP